MAIKEKKELRRLIADYMQSEGCSCCRNDDKHREDKESLAKILNVPKYEDGSGYDFNKFATNQLT